MDNFS